MFSGYVLTFNYQHRVMHIILDTEKKSSLIIPKQHTIGL